jgi:2-oxoisovalerate dehydrogenase E1 component alpha subunit
LAAKDAREYIVTNKAPAFIEFMTYRIGDHSTSDHSILYRSEDEIKFWKKENNPIDRLGLYLRNHR